MDAAAGSDAGQAARNAANAAAEARGLSGTGAETGQGTPPLAPNTAPETTDLTVLSSELTSMQDSVQQPTTTLGTLTNAVGELHAERGHLQARLDVPLRHADTMRTPERGTLGHAFRSPRSLFAGFFGSQRPSADLDLPDLLNLTPPSEAPPHPVTDLGRMATTAASKATQMAALMRLPFKFDPVDDSTLQKYKDQHEVLMSEVETLLSWAASAIQQKGGRPCASSFPASAGQWACGTGTTLRLLTGIPVDRGPITDLLQAFKSRFTGEGRMRPLGALTS